MSSTLFGERSLTRRSSIVVPQSDGIRLGMKAKNSEQVLVSRYI